MPRRACIEAATRFGIRSWLTAFGCAVVALLLFSPAARAGVDDQCPAIADKPDAVPHVDYTGVQHLTYCYGPITIFPGQNIIRFQPAIDDGQNLAPASLIFAPQPLQTPAR